SGTVLKAGVTPVSCLGWSLADGDTHTAVHVGDKLPGVPQDGNGKDMTIQISTPNVNGYKIDAFYMQPGRAAVIKAGSAKADFPAGPMYLVCDNGVKFGIPDQNIAKALGLDKQSSGPISIVGLLQN